MRILLTVAAAALVGGCSMKADMAAGDKAIAAFHQALNAGQSRQILAGASPEFRAVTPEPQALRLFDTVHARLGAFKDGKSVGFNDNVSSGGHMLVDRYEAHYQNGTALETFTFRVSGDRAVMIGYNVNSNALLLQ